MWRLFDYPSKPWNISTDYSPENGGTADQSIAAEINDSSDVVGIQCPDDQYSTVQSSDQIADINVSNLALGSTFTLEASDASYNDWSLFGKSWLDYFPVDITFEQ